MTSNQVVFIKTTAVILISKFWILLSQCWKIYQLSKVWSRDSLYVSIRS